MFRFRPAATAAKVKVLIVEPEAAGHHMVLYFRHITREVLARGWHLRLLTSRSATAHPAFLEVAKEFSGRFEVTQMPDVAPPQRRQTPIALGRWHLRHYRAMARAFDGLAEDQRPNVIYLNNLDGIDKLLPVLGSPFRGTRFAGLLMSIRFHHSKVGVMEPRRWRNPLLKVLFRRLLRLPSLGAVIVTDESFRDFIAQQRFPDREKVVFAAEPGGFPDGRRRTDARRRLGVRDEQVVLLVYGSIEARKGVLALSRAVADGACPRELMVLLAGTKADDVLNVRHESALQALRDGGRLIEISGFFTGEEELEVFSAADIVWLAYEGFYGMSGVLVQAGSMGLPVIACEEGLIGWVTKKYGMGITVRAREVASVVGALSRLASDSTLRRELGENGRAMAKGHDPRSFGRCVCDVLERLGQAGAPGQG